MKFYFAHCALTGYKRLKYVHMKGDEVQSFKSLCKYTARSFLFWR